MILTVRMNIQILSVLQSDPFTKSVFTSVLPSDRSPDIVLQRPKGYIVNVDGSDKPGSHWVAMFFPSTPDGEGDGAAEFMDSLGEKPNHYSEHFKTFYKTIAVLIFIRAVERQSGPRDNISIRARLEFLALLCISKTK